jgi:outer membrane murein-binding lipoprotein Lpp
MARTLFVGISLVGIGVVAGVFVGSRGGSTDLRVAQEINGEAASASVRRGLGTRVVQAGGDGHTEQLQRRLDRLAAQVATDAAQRQRLQERIEALAAEVAALRSSAPGMAPASSAPHALSGATPRAGDAVPGQVAEPGTAGGVSTLERALVAAGVDPAAAADIKRRQDALTLEEIYLRDQATREQWLDSPRFADEMAKIQKQRTSMRDELGDDAYDQYLAALGQPNRVRIEDVLHDSAAAQAGLQVGDVVLRYGDTRIFAVDGLVASTHGGPLGEPVQLQIMRNGQLLQIGVPRGPLGVSITGVVEPASAAR